MTELLTARDTVAGADLVELRLDGVADADVAGALRGRRPPVIVTCRPTWEGGRFDGAEDTRLRLLAAALAAGAEFVDVEFRACTEQPAFADLVAAHGPRVVLSTHDFDGVPADLVGRARAMRGSGAGTIKLAVTVTRLSDTLALREIARDGHAVVIGMGDAGVPTRLLASRFGSRWTYGGNAVAPGQIPAARMIEEFGFRRIGDRTRLFGVVSTNALHSLSPAMHNAAFAAGGIDAVYVPLRAADFDDFQAFAAAMGIEGASITIPFKRDALAAAASSDPLTQRVGAANTLRRVDSQSPDRQTRIPTEAAEAPAPRWEATNTDVAGFLAPLEELVGGTFEGLRASVLGAGGAARAVVVALRSRGATVTVHARRREQAEEVTAYLGAVSGPWPPAPRSWDLLVNCTPLGGGPLRDESPLPDGPLDGRCVYDLTYAAGDSALLRDARAAGCATLDGLPMLVAQAELQFAWWTGQTPLPGVMRAAADARLGLSAPAHSRV